MPVKDRQFLVMTDAQLEDFLLAMRTASPRFWHPFFRLSAELGLRVSETAALRWETADRERSAIGVATLKQRPPILPKRMRTDSDAVERWQKRTEGWTPAIHWLPMNADTLECLDTRAGREEWPERGLIFPSTHRTEGREEHPITRKAAAFAMKRGLRMAGLPMAFSPHCLRHYLGFRGVRAGLSIPQIQKLLRHSSPRSAAVYLSMPSGPDGAEELRAFQDKLHATK